MIELTYLMGYLIGLIIWYRFEIIIGFSALVFIGACAWFFARFLKD